MERHLIPLEGSFTMDGTVVKEGWSRSRRRWLQVEGGGVQVGKASIRYPGAIRIYGEGREVARAGDRVRLEISGIRQAEQKYPGGFDAAAWRVQEGFHASATLDRVRSRTRDSTRWFGMTRRWVSSIHAHLRNLPLSNRNRGLLIAILTGDRSGLGSETETDMRRSGLAHVMAVSGLHVALVLAPFWWIFLRIRYRWIALTFWACTGALLLLYVAIAEQSPSVVRAASMAWIGGCLMILMRRWPPIHLLTLVGGFALLWRPIWLVHPGFQLSMVAVGAIATLYTPLQRRIDVFVKNPATRSILSTLSLTAIIQVALSPLLLWWFGELSVVAPLSNLVVVPLLPLITLGGWTLALLTHMDVSPVGLLQGLNGLLEWIRWLATTTSGISHATIKPEWRSILCLLPILWAFAVDVSWFHTSRARTRVWYQMALILFLVSIVNGLERRKLVVTLLDVGQGDAIHLQTPGGKHLLIDTGTGGATEHVVIPYLREEGVDSLDLLLLTHPHTDHTGGAEQLKREIPVKRRVVAHGEGVDSHWARALNPRSVRLPEAGGKIVNLDPWIRLYLLERDPAIHSVNNRSIVLKLQYGETSMLFPGDIESGQELALSRTYGTWLKADLLKAGHHGSRTSSNRLFLQMVDPDWILVSAGWGNRYGHPHRQALKRFQSQGSAVRVTARSRTIRFKSDGRSVREVEWN